MRAIDAEHYLLELKLKRDKVASFERYPFSLPVVRHLDLPPLSHTSRI